MALQSLGPKKLTRKVSRVTGGSKLTRPPHAVSIASHIRNLILEGVLRPDMRVPQGAIAESLGVSRTPLREALIVLEREGWLTKHPYRGTFVNRLDEQIFHDNYELLGLICGFAAQRAMARCGMSLSQKLAAIQ